jgi:predicted TIM-barrel fold metal-dependent hydrolase
VTSAGEGELADAGVPAWCDRLGLPGLVDCHVHFMPERVLAKVWAYFDAAGPLVGRPWPITYRGSDTERLDQLRALGVRAFPALSYPHRPGMAGWLNDWAREFAAAHPEVVPSATLFPEPGVADYLAAALSDGARVVKVHVQVGGFDPRDPLLDAAWELLAEAGTPVVIHAGSGPAPGRFTGPAPIAEILRRHTRLLLVIAHLGMPETDAFLGIAEESERVHLDTTMAFTDFASGGREAALRLGERLAPRLLALQERIVLGSDFPNIPYPYAHQLAALERLGLGDDWLRAVCWHNGARLLGVADATAPVTGRGRAAAGPPCRPQR